MNEALKIPQSLHLSVQQHDPGETIHLFTGQTDAHTAVGEVYNFDDFPCLEEEQVEDAEEIAVATAEKIVRAYNSHDDLLKACEAAHSLLHKLGTEKRMEFTKETPKEVGWYWLKPDPEVWPRLPEDIREAIMVAVYKRGDEWYFDDPINHETYACVCEQPGRLWAGPLKPPQDAEPIDPDDMARFQRAILAALP